MGSTVTWFNNDRAIITPGPKREKGEQLSENRGPCMEKARLVKGRGQPEATWQEGNKRHAYPHFPVPFGPPKLLPGPLCQTPIDRLRTKMPLDAVHRAQRQKTT